MKKLLSALLITALAVCSIFSLVSCGNYQDNIDTDDIVYRFDSETQTYFVSGTRNRNIETLEIPAMYEGKPVTGIGGDAFSGCDGLTSITIPDGITWIGGWAFSGCDGLASITIPDSVTLIGRMAFDGTAYYNDENNWEDGVLYIGKHLIDATVSGDYQIKAGTLTIASLAFFLCTKLTSITIPDSVTSINNRAFDSCTSLASITIPDSVTSIGSYTFNGCTSLTSITIPDSVTSIEGYAFNGC